MRKPGQANIEEHPKGSGLYRVRARIDGKLKTIASKLPLAQAEEAASAYTLLRNEDELRQGVTLAQFGVGFLNRRERRGVRGMKQERDRWRLYIAPTIGKLCLVDVRRRDVKDWLDRLTSKGLAAQTLRNARNLLSLAFDDAVDREIITTNPARGVKVGKSTTKEEDLSGVLNPVEQQRLIRCCPERDRPIVLFALLTGIRLSEQWWLRWTDVRPDHILVRTSVGGKSTKGGKPRRVPLLGPAAAILTSLPRVSEFVFPAPRGGRRHYGHRPAGWTKALEDADFGRRVRWHDLRHTCGTSLLAGWWGRRWSLEEVRGFLGHSTVKITERYARILDETVTSAAAGTFPESSQDSAGPIVELADFLGRRGSDSNRRLTVLQSVPQVSNSAALPDEASPPGNDLEDPGDDEGPLIGAARRRTDRLEALAELDPTARPGLAVCRGLQAAYEGDLDEVERRLAEALDAYEGEPEPVADARMGGAS